MPESGISVAVAVRHCCSLLCQRLEQAREHPGVVIGCGSGNEVVHLRRALNNPHIVGLDIRPNFSLLARTEANMLVADAESLPFPSQSFDFAAAIHSLEHMDNPYIAVREVHRVLRPGGWFYVGAPNKTRLVGYLGAFGASSQQKLAWNLRGSTAKVTL